MKHFTIYTLSTLLVLAACEREAIPTNERETPGEGERITLRFEAPVTRSEIDGTTGAMTWTSGDQIAVCCTDGATKRYETVTVNTSASTADITMGVSDSRCDYAVFPASAVPASPTAAQFTAPAVVFPTTYDIRGKNAETYSPCPMVAVNSGSTLDFYHVGALVRIQLTDVPEGTAAIRVTFTGMTHVTGTYNVSGAGTAGATLSLASGTGNTVTVTIDADDEYVNIPIPQGDYSALTGLSVEALDSSNAMLGTANQAVSWSTFTRGRGRNSDVIFVINFASRFLTFDVVSDGTILWKLSDASGSAKTISYRKNGGEWTSITSSTSGASISVSAGDKVQFKGSNTQYATSTSYYSCFGGTATFNASGNIMSLIGGDNFSGLTTLSAQYAFLSLFKNSNVISAINLILPATTLATYCYQYMFQGCTSLTTAPELPATTLANNCYNYMFQGCSSLRTAPELPATTLANNCYNYMFYGCSSLRTAPELPATTLANSCYSYMFNGCSSLRTAPELPATTLTSDCYKNMFQGCSSLTTAPELPATTLTNSCYSYMFEGCSSLTTAPELPATTLADYCYRYMFYSCTSLITAPELPATTLATYCYENMFFGCSSLTTAPELPATTLANYCYSYMFYLCTSLTTAPELPATTLTSNCYENMFYGCSSLTIAPELPATTLANYCYSYMFYGCSSLTTAPELPATTLANYCYRYMFRGCTSLTTAPELPATTLTNSCYSYMFYGCTSLTTAPELPATKLTNSCYSYMFYRCQKLNYIKAMFTTTPSTSYTQNWVNSVAASGTFIKNSAATWNVTGANGVPSGWTVVTQTP